MAALKSHDEIIELLVTEVQAVPGGGQPENNPPGIVASAVSSIYPEVDNNPPIPPR